jgi:hypothetical protein
MFGEAISLKPVIFTESTEVISGVRSEYYVEGSRIKFHFWPDPEFPDGFEECLKDAFKNVPQDNVIIEYVPEVDSWYTEVRATSFKPTASILESIVAKIGRGVLGAKK